MLPTGDAGEDSATAQKEPGEKESPPDDPGPEPREHVGQLLWTQTLEASSRRTLHGVAVGPNDHIYAVGMTDPPAVAQLVKFDPEGQVLWELTLDDLPDSSAEDVTVVGEQVIATGATQDTRPWVATFDLDGQRLDTVTDPETTGTPLDIATLDGSSWFIGGRTDGPQRGWVAAYVGGTRSWIDQLPDGSSVNDVTATGDGVVATGYITDDTRRLWMRSYDAQGNVLWTSTLADRDSSGHGIRSLAGGDVIVAGTADGAGSLARYNGQGTERWSRIVELSAAASAVGSEATIDPWGNILLSGFATSGDRSAWVAKFTSDGGALWTRASDTIDALAGKLAYSLDVDSQGATVVVGTDDERSRAWITKLSP